MADTQIAEKPKTTFSQALTTALVDNHEALPKDFNKARFVQNAIALLNDNPNLQKFGSSQLKAGLMKSAVLGLDAFNKECYLIPYGSQLNFQIDYRGAKKLAKKYSIRPIKDIYAEVVREGDAFEKKVEDNKTTVKFEPIPFSDNPVIGAFAVVEYMDGGLVCDMMSLKELEKTRSKSKANNSMAWKDFTTEMYRKTVLHRLCKHIELEFENVGQMDLWNDSNAMEKKEEVQTDNPFEDDNIIDVEVVDG